MSEHVYAFLLRLYPSHFRSVYGEEALQLVRDRARDESALRLWIDLLLDLAWSLPRLHLRPAPIAPRATSPGFLLLEGEAPRPEAISLGLVASLFLIVAAIPISQFLARIPVAPLRAMQVAAQAPTQLTSADRHRLVEAVAAAVAQYYFDKHVALTTASALLAHEQAGDYKRVTGGQAFANLLARHLTEASGDNHFTMEYTANVFPDFSKPPAPPPEAQARYRAAMEQANCTFEKVEILRNNVGYVKLNSFPDTAVCKSKAESAMAIVNHADALIFDLRDNRGGFPDMVVFLAGYLFDHPEFMYSPRAPNPITEQSWTRSPVAGSLLTDKPVYILTSSRTYSGAEHFSYDLKMLKRATLIGETTGGASHDGVLHNLDDHFAVGIPDHRPVNPFSGKDWAITGVEPDVKVEAADALATAGKLIETKLRRR